MFIVVLLELLSHMIILDRNRQDSFGHSLHYGAKLWCLEADGRTGSKKLSRSHSEHCYV